VSTDEGREVKGNLQLYPCNLSLESFSTSSPKGDKVLLRAFVRVGIALLTM
jgi:hypothetical protein